MPVAEEKRAGADIARRGSKNEDKRSMTDDLKEHMDDGSSCAVAKLELLRCDCGPSDCPVGERLELSMDFVLDRPLRDASWEVKVQVLVTFADAQSLFFSKFVVDSVHERHVIPLGATSRKDYPNGESSMHFEAPSVSVEGIKPCALANTGLLVAVLKCSSSHDNRAHGNNEDEVGERNKGRCLENDKNYSGEHKGDEKQGGGAVLEDVEVAAVNLVVQVSDGGRGRLVRCIYSPLE